MATYKYNYIKYASSKTATRISKRISKTSERLPYGLASFIILLACSLITHNHEYTIIGLVIFGIEILLAVINNRTFGERKIIKALAKDNPELFSEKALQMINSGDNSQIDSVINDFKQITGHKEL